MTRPGYLLHNSLTNKLMVSQVMDWSTSRQQLIKITESTTLICTLNQNLTINPINWWKCRSSV